MSAALVAEVRDRHTDQRVDAGGQIQREAAKKYREETEQPSVIEKDTLDCAAGVITRRRFHHSSRRPQQRPRSRAAAAPGAASATVVLTDAGRKHSLLLQPW